MLKEFVYVASKCAPHFVHATDKKKVFQSKANHPVVTGPGWVGGWGCPSEQI